MRRLVLVMVAMGVMASACSGEELSAEKDFGQRIEKFGETAYTVTYQMDVINEGEPSAVRQVIYSDGMSRRVDYQTGEVLTIQITTEEVRYRCSDNSEDPPTCFEIRLAGGSSSPAFGLDSIAGQIDFVETYQLSPAAGRTVAGVEAECFLFEDDRDPEPHTEICLADDGLILYGSSRIADVYLATTEAVEIKRSVPDGIFEQPYALSPCNDGIGSPGCPDSDLEE